MVISLAFHGAARQVTGSKHLLRVGDRRVLLDCGMVQGPRRLAQRLNRELPFDAREIDAVVLSHAHVDHSGSLPRLVKKGFRGKIHCTPATADLLGILLPDSAHLQAADARYLKKHGHHFEPAYDGQDVERTLEHLQTTGYGHSFEVCPGVQATFLDAGHILGSAQVVLDADDAGRRLRIGFTGDLGRRDMPILRDPEELPACDVILTESTYGDRRHPPREELERQLSALLDEVQGWNGRIVIPAFSVGRTQNALWYLGQLIDSGRLAPLPIYVDSPLSTKATTIVARHAELFDETTRALLEGGRSPFYFPGVRCITDVEESKALNQVRRGIILSASGMCEGGRVLHHLTHTLSHPEDCVLIIGYQANGTLGRKLLEGFETVHIYGRRLDVRCHVRHVNGLSAHADLDGLLGHLVPHAQRTQRVFVVHGEENPAMRFAGRLEGEGFREVIVPLQGESYEL